jgi:thymidylate synthase (FAD)
MKLIESKAEYIPQEEGLEGIYKSIELAGRTAYHSQDKITSDSAKDFVDRMIKSKHGAALEHGTVYLSFKLATYNRLGREVISKYVKNKYSKVVYVSNSAYHRGPSYKLFDVMQDDIRGDRTYYISTNLRVLVENGWLDDLQYLCSPSEFHEKRYTMRFTCSRAIANELVRHRVFSFLQESTRYINYSKERHGGEITYIIPSWLEGNDNEERFIEYLKVCEKLYIEMLSGIERRGIITMPADKLTPQQARDVLPNATKTELIMTGFSSDWRHVIDLRLFGKTGAPHPDMVDLMQKAQASMQEAGIWDDIMSKPSKFE